LSTDRTIDFIAANVKYEHVNFYLSTVKLTTGGARNKGIAIAQGRYLLFADSDDLFTDDAFEIFDNAIKSNLEYYMFKVTSFIEDTGKKGNRHEYLQNYYDENGLTLRLGNNQPVAKLVSRQFVNKQTILFSEVIGGDDIFFSIQIAIFSQSFKFIPSVVYKISQNDDSISKSTELAIKVSFIHEDMNKYKFIISHTSLLFWFPYLYKYNKIDYYKSLVVNDNLAEDVRLVAIDYLNGMPVSIKVTVRVFDLICSVFFKIKRLVNKLI
jgi:glycosyltransferase involved in cell wall biosynthesis